MNIDKYTTICNELYVPENQELNVAGLFDFKGGVRKIDLSDYLGADTSPLKETQECSNFIKLTGEFFKEKPLALIQRQRASPPVVPFVGVVLTSKFVQPSVLATASEQNLSESAKIGETANEEEDGYEICAGDRIQLGCTDLYVLETKSVGNTQADSIVNQPYIIDKYILPSGNCDDDDCITCRICLSHQDEKDPGQPLVSFCNCLGSCAYVHPGCFRKWIDRLRDNQDLSRFTKIDILESKMLICDLCKSVIPWKLSCEGREYVLIQMKPPADQNTHYITIEKISRNDNHRCAAQISNLDKITIGRSLTNNMVITGDNSVSKLHCIVSFEKNKWWIRDAGSTFGTIVEPHNLPDKAKLKNTFLKYRSALFRIQTDSSPPHDEATSQSLPTQKKKNISALSEVGNALREERDHEEKTSRFISRQSKKIKKLSYC